MVFLFVAGSFAAGHGLVGEGDERGSTQASMANEPLSGRGLGRGVLSRQSKNLNAGFRVAHIKNREVNHAMLALTLLVLGVLADHAHDAAAVNDLALVTNFLY
jgi:hypothetical protein